MSTIAEEQKADLAHVDQIDRIEPHVGEGQVKCTVVDDARCLAQIFLHKSSRAQMRPCQAGFFEIFLDCQVHDAKRKCGIRPSVQAREFDNVANACGLGSVDKRVLRFDHIHEGSRDHEYSVDAV